MTQQENITQILEEMTSEDKALAQELLASAREEAGDDATPMQMWAILQHALKPSMALTVHQWCYQHTYATDWSP